MWSHLSSILWRCGFQILETPRRCGHQGAAAGLSAGVRLCPWPLWQKVPSFGWPASARVHYLVAETDCNPAHASHLGRAPLSRMQPTHPSTATLPSHLTFWLLSLPFIQCLLSSSILNVSAFSSPGARGGYSELWKCSLCHCWVSCRRKSSTASFMQEDAHPRVIYKSDRSKPFLNGKP